MFFYHCIWQETHHFPTFSRTICFFCHFLSIYEAINQIITSNYHHKHHYYQPGVLVRIPYAPFSSKFFKYYFNQYLLLLSVAAIRISCPGISKTVVSAYVGLQQCVKNNLWVVFFFLLRWVQDVPVWLWNTTCWNQCRGSLSTSCCSQVQTHTHSLFEFVVAAPAHFRSAVYWIMVLFYWQHMNSNWGLSVLVSLGVSTDTQWTNTVAETCGRNSSVCKNRFPSFKIMWNLFALLQIISRIFQRTQRIIKTHKVRKKDNITLKKTTQGQEINIKYLNNHLFSCQT